MYGHYLPVRWFKSLVKSACQELGFYQSHLETKSFGTGGKITLSSPVLARVAGALAARTGGRSVNVGKSSPKTPGSSLTPITTHSPVLPAPSVVAIPGASWGHLDVPLPYSSEEKRQSYRSTSPVVLPTSTLRYNVLPVETVLGADKITQPRLKGRNVYKPELKIAGTFTAKALIDRMFIIFATKNLTSALNIQRKIKSQLNETTFIHDLNSGRTELEWPNEVILPPHLDPGLGTGRVFLAQIQEVTPKKLADVLDFCQAQWGLFGPVRPFLIELALDFYPAKAHDANTAIQLREQMVGLLQRHHHIEDEAFKLPDSDARQVYEPKPNQLKTEYLFDNPKFGMRTSPDTKLSEFSVRSRLKLVDPGKQLFLDATLYKGSEKDNLLVRIQHKTGDQRNKTRKTVKILPDDQRRARIEVQISGHQRLEEYGLAEIGDMKGFSFRRMRNRHLSFWLPTTSHDPKAVEIVRQQLVSRGVYGVERLQQLERHEERKVRPRHKGSLTGKPGRPVGTGASGTRVAWTECNEAVGKALDALAFKWKKFGWPH